MAEAFAAENQPDKRFARNTEEPPPTWPSGGVRTAGICHRRGEPDGQHEYHSAAGSGTRLLPARVRHALPTGAAHFGHASRPDYASSQILIASGSGATWFRTSFVANIGSKLSSTSPCTPWMTRYQTGNWEMTIR